jgi:hypothetical protein
VVLLERAPARAETKARRGMNWDGRTIRFARFKVGVWYAWARVWKDGVLVFDKAEECGSRPRGGVL